MSEQQQAGRWDAFKLPPWLAEQMRHHELVYGPYPDDIIDEDWSKRIAEAWMAPGGWLHRDQAEEMSSTVGQAMTTEIVATIRLEFERGAIPPVVHVHLPSADSTVEVLAAIADLKATLATSQVAETAQLSEGFTTMALDTAALAAEITEQSTVIDGLATFTAGLAEQIRTLSAEVASEPAVQAALTQFAADLDANTARIGAAMLTGTPAAETEPVPEVPAEPTEPTA